MLATCRKSIEILFHGSYMHIIPQHVSGHVRDTCMKVLGINKCILHMLVTCRKYFRINNVSFSSTMVRWQPLPRNTRWAVPDLATESSGSVFFKSKSECPFRVSSPTLPPTVMVVIVSPIRLKGCTQESHTPFFSAHDMSPVAQATTGIVIPWQVPATQVTSALRTAMKVCNASLFRIITRVELWFQNVLSNYSYSFQEFVNAIVIETTLTISLLMWE